MHHETCSTTDLACRIVVGISALPTRRVATLTNGPPPEAEAGGSPDGVLAPWFRTPLELVAFSYSHILTYIVILVEYFSRAEGLYFLGAEAHFASLLHAR